MDYRMDLIYVTAVLIATHVDGVTIPWPAELQNRPDLICNNTETIVSNQPGHQTHFADNCRCCCEGYAIWEKSHNQTLALYVEYTDTKGHSIIISSYNNISSFPYHILRHTNNIMSTLPGNIVDFSDYLVLLDLSHNRLVSPLDRLNQLRRLDTLNLTGNLLTALSNTSFVGMKDLRLLDLSNNKIHTLEPGLLDSLVTLMDVNLNDNLLTELDGTNIILRHPFCEISYERNAISEVTNKLNRVLNMSLSYGPGKVELQNNAFESFFDFEKLGVPDISQIGRLMSFDIQITNINWTCDCHMVPFLQLTNFTLKGGWMGSDDIKCYNPVNLRGKSIVSLVRSDDLDLFNCTLTEAKDGCPHGCTCIDQPSKDRLIVDCDGAGLKGSLPSTLPTSIANKIEMHLANNSLEVLNITEYLSRVSVLDISNNNLNIITDIAATALRNASVLSLQNNENLRDLPAQMKDMDPARVILGNKTMDCDCDSEWLGEWVRVKGSNTSHISNIMCRTDKGFVLAKDFGKDFLNCIPENLDNLWLGLILAASSLLLIAAGVLIFIFRYELVLLFRYAFSVKKNNICPAFENDVYISIDEENDYLLEWVRNYLLPVLEASGYVVFLPVRQICPGEAKQDAILNAVQRSRSFLYIVSESKGSDFNDEELDENAIQWNCIEWQYGWSMFKRDAHRNIVVINFDQIDSSQIKIKSLRAFVRLRLHIDIANRQRLFINCLKNKLGRPPHLKLSKTLNPNNCDGVCRTRFQTVVNTEVLI